MGRQGRRGRGVWHGVLALAVALGGLALYWHAGGFALRGAGSRKWDKVLQLLCLGPGVVCLSSWVGMHVRRDLAAGLSRLSSKGPVPLLVVGLAFLLALAAGPLRGLPGSRDEVEYLFQGRVLMTGRLGAPPPPCPASFALRGMTIHRGRWITPYEPGHPLLLGLADRLGASWLVGPLMGVVALSLLFLLADSLWGRGVAMASLALGVLSPFFLFLAACHSYHVTSLVLSSLLFLAQARPGPGWGLVAGAAGGALLFVRPLALAFLASPMVLIEVHRARAGIPRRRWICAGATFLVFCALFLAYNHRVTGHPLRTTREVVYPYGLFGFGPRSAHIPTYGTQGHTPLKGLRNVGVQLGTLSTGLLGWPAISLLPAVLGFLARRRGVWPWVFALAVGATAGVLFFSWYPAVEHGPRHYLDSWPGLIILSALGLQDATAWFRRKYGAGGSNSVLIAVLGFFALSAALYIPVRLADLTTRTLWVDPTVHEAVRTQVVTPALVFLDCPSHPADYYCSGFVHNDPLLRGPILYARHLGTREDAQCLQHFPGRRGYRVTYDPATGRVEVSPMPHAPASPVQGGDSGGGGSE